LELRDQLRAEEIISDLDKKAAAASSSSPLLKNMPEADRSAVLEFCGINNNNHIASSSTSPTRCHDCPAARSLRTSSTFRLQMCCKFVCKQTSPFETKDSNVNKGENSCFAADSFLGVTGSLTVLDHVEDNCTNIRYYLFQGSSIFPQEIFFPSQQNSSQG
jgi:hypothetical protein